jgi:hypothetical protein
MRKNDIILILKKTKEVNYIQKKVSFLGGEKKMMEEMSSKFYQMKSYLFLDGATYIETQNIHRIQGSLL